MDTTLVPAIVRVRACRKGLFCGQASFGRCRSKTEWVYGFKVALVVDPDGVVTAFGLAPANRDERPIGEALIASERHDAYLAGRQGVLLAGVGASLAGGPRGALVAATPKDNSRRSWSATDRRWAAGKRQVIEQVISQLNEGLLRPGASPGEDPGRPTGPFLAAKIAAYTCGQWLNSQLGRPLRHLAALLV